MIRKYRATLSAVVCLAFAAGCATASTLVSDPPLDRGFVPAPGPVPEYDFPAVERHELSNGLAVWVVPQRGLPLVTVQLLLPAGGVVEPEGLDGLASLTANLLREGTSSRTATQISDDLDFLAATLTAGTGRETAVVTLSSLARNLEESLEIFADVVVHPTFPESEWSRARDQRLAAIAQSRVQAATLATEEFAVRVYGANHGYSRLLQGTQETVGSMTSANVREFHERHYRPRNATLIVVGDVAAADLLPTLERTFGAWPDAPAPPPAMLPMPPPLPETTIYLVDRPAAPQSEVRLGHVGVNRSHPDYFPVLVMNSILGGQFSSRINLNLREDKGYTYGASSSFVASRFAGPFTAGAAVQTAVTAESIVEFMRELEEIRGARPITAEELEFAKTSIIRRAPLSGETRAQIADRLQQILHFELPLDYFDRFNERVDAVTLESVNRVARDHLRPDRLAIVVVGDRATIEPALRSLPYPLLVVAEAGH